MHVRLTSWEISEILLVMGENDTDVKESLADITRVLQEVRLSVTNLSGRLEEIQNKGHANHAMGNNTVNTNTVHT